MVLFAIWLISLTGLAFTIPGVVRSFKAEASERVVKTYNFDNKTPVLTLSEAGMEDYQATSLRLLGHSEANFKLVEKFYSRGLSRQNALANARMVDYNVDQEDSVLIFDSNFKFKKDAVFRAQELDMILYIPYNTPFLMTENLKHIIRNTIYQSGHSVDQMEGNQWMFTEDGLQCITCIEDDSEAPEQIEAPEEPEEPEEVEDPETNATGDIGIISRDLKDFDNLEIAGFFEIVVTQDKNYAVNISGDKELLDNIKVERNAGTLKISETKFELSSGFLKPKVKVVINMPKLEAIKLSGITQSYVEGFETDNFEADLSGSSRSEFHIKTKDIKLELNGDSKLTLVGSGNYMEADLSGASRLLAEDFQTENASVEASGISKAYLNVSGSLEIETHGAGAVQNNHKKSTSEASNITAPRFYISKAQIIYYAALIKAGVIGDEASLGSFLSDK